MAWAASEGDDNESPSGSGKDRQSSTKVADRVMTCFLRYAMAGVAVAEQPGGGEAEPSFSLEWERNFRL